jgi:hypothetical protein
MSWDFMGGNKNLASHGPGDNYPSGQKVSYLVKMSEIFHTL